MALSPYEKRILDFNYIIAKQPELLSTEDKVSLEQLISNLPDEIEEISNEISLWMKEHPNVLNALLGIPPIGSADRGLGGNTINLTPKVAKDLIENTIRQSNPPIPCPRAVAKSHNQSIEVDWETRGLGDGEIKLNFRENE